MIRRKARIDRFALQRKVPGFVASATTKRPRAPKVTIKEKDLQSMAENLCLALGIRFFRLPDSLLAYLARCPDAWVRVFVSRYLAGVPDLMLFRALPEGKNEVGFIEIKTEAGKVHQSQEKWHSGLHVQVCYGWDETEAAIRRFHERPDAKRPEPVSGEGPTRNNSSPGIEESRPEKE
jgi:hypothetical protein